MAGNEQVDLPEERRKEVFAALVEAQDQQMSVSQSRLLVGERYGLTDAQIRQIEREGMDQQWPPLE